MRGLLGNLALGLGALLATFLVLELGARLLVDRSEHGPIAVRDVDPANPLRFRPWSERVYETSEFRYTVSFNRFGRRDVEWTDAVIRDPGSVLFIGDSFVLGNGVENEDSIPSLLERWFEERGAPREVLNFGMPGGDPGTYGRLLEQALDDGFRARTVVVGVFVGNDFYPSVLAPRRPPRPAPPPQPAARAWPRSKLLQFVKQRLSSSPRTVGWALAAGRLLGIPVYDTAGSYIFMREPAPDQRLLFERILAFFDGMKAHCDRRGCTLHLVVFPNKLQVENRDDLTTSVLDAERPNRRILEHCRGLGIACLDLLPVLASAWEADAEPLYFPIDRHLNPRGTRVAADAIGAFLEHEAP